MSDFLEVDSKILERNLVLQKDSQDVENLEKYLRSPNICGTEKARWTLASPIAGFCLKTTDVGSKKIFINVCQLDALPEPKEITEEELLELWQSEDSDVIPNFRVPLAMEHPHDEFDKSGNPTVVYDVAINTKFFQKIKANEVFRTFVVQVIFAGIENKYDVQIKKEGFVILQNRKCLGELKPFWIRIDDSSFYGSRPLIEEVPKSFSGDGHVLQKSIPTATKFRFFENTRQKFLVGEFYLPEVIFPKELTLNVGNNRVVLESQRGISILDTFLPFAIDESKAKARFSKSRKMLTLKIPIYYN